MHVAWTSMQTKKAFNSFFYLVQYSASVPFILFCLHFLSSIKTIIKCDSHALILTRTMTHFDYSHNNFVDIMLRSCLHVYVYLDLDRLDGACMKISVQWIRVQIGTSLSLISLCLIFYYVYISIKDSSCHFKGNLIVKETKKRRRKKWEAQKVKENKKRKKRKEKKVN